jgi:hypothetical protein
MSQSESHHSSKSSTTHYRRPQTPAPRRPAKSLKASETIGTQATKDGNPTPHAAHLTPHFDPKPGTRVIVSPGENNEFEAVILRVQSDRSVLLLRPDGCVDIEYYGSGIGGRGYDMAVAEAGSSPQEPFVSDPVRMAEALATALSTVPIGADPEMPDGFCKALPLPEWHAMIVRANAMLLDATGVEKSQFVVMVETGEGRVTKFEERRIDLSETREALEHLAFVAEKWMGMAATAAVTGDYIGGPREQIRDAAKNQSGKSKSVAA